MSEEQPNYQQPSHPQYQPPRDWQWQSLPPPAPKKRRRWPWIVGIIVAIIVLAVIIGGLIYKNTSSTVAYSAANVVDTNVATMDKDGNSDRGMSVHFTATILNFVKDSNGNTAGANVDDPNTSGVIQVVFPSGTDLSHLNTEDTLEVWGVAAVSMTDQTTG